MFEIDIKLGHMNNMRKIREQNRCLQSELAEYLNVHQSTVSGWERGRAPIDSNMLPKISNYFNVSIDHLLGIEAENIKPIIKKRLPLLGETAAGDGTRKLTTGKSFRKIERIS